MPGFGCTKLSTLPCEAQWDSTGNLLLSMHIRKISKFAHVYGRQCCGEIRSCLKCTLNVGPIFICNIPWFVESYSLISGEVSCPGLS